MGEQTPVLAVDAIVERTQSAGRRSKEIAIVERKHEPVGLALPGGMVEVGETIEEAVRREINEEIGIELDQVRQWRVFSDPDRDPRQHTVSVVFHAMTEADSLTAASDAAEAHFYSHDEFAPGGERADELVFDHARIIQHFYSLYPETDEGV